MLKLEPLKRVQPQKTKCLMVSFPLIFKRQFVQRQILELWWFCTKLKKAFLIEIINYSLVTPFKVSCIFKNTVMNIQFYCHISSKFNDNFKDNFVYLIVLMIHTK